MGHTFNRFCTHRPQDRHLPGADKISAVPSINMEPANMEKLIRFRNVVNGTLSESSTGRWLPSTNPFTGENWAEVPHCGVDDVECCR